MKKPLRKDYSGAAGGGVGAAVGLLIIGALQQFAGIDVDPLYGGAIITVVSAVVSLIASYVVPLSDGEQQEVASVLMARALQATAVERAKARMKAKDE